MSTALWIVGILLLAVHVYRSYWTYRSLPREQVSQFDGEILCVGQTFIARRPARGNSIKTVVCFPGFLEDMRYFHALYSDVKCELILVNNANYHCAFPADGAAQLQWPDNPFPVGSIEHDGFYLGLVLKELVSGSEVILHGHSRGGAVVLEMGRQYPTLVKSGAQSVAAILEAPVLPRAHVVGNGSDPVPHHLMRYFMPPVLGLSRRSSLQQLLKQPMMTPTNDLKNSVCSSIYTNPRQYRTCVANVKSIRRWQLQSDYHLYTNFEKLTVVVGARDDVLDNSSMLASAEAGRELNAGVEILRTENTNHFPTLEQPRYLRELVAAD